MDSGEDQPEFEVVIPPKGGHGADIYRELGGFRVMVYSKFDNNVMIKQIILLEMIFLVLE